MMISIGSYTLLCYKINIFIFYLKRYDEVFQNIVMCLLLAWQSLPNMIDSFLSAWLIAVIQFVQRKERRKNGREWRREREDRKKRKEKRNEGEIPRVNNLGVLFNKRWESHG